MKYLLEIDRPTAIVYPFPMATAPKQDAATEETGAITPTGPLPASTKEPARGFLAVARRNLTADELASPGVLRMLVAEIERLDVVCDEHQSMSVKYHDQRVLVATLTEQSKTSKWHEVLFISAISIGSALVGAAPAYFEVHGGLAVGVVVLALGIALTAIGVISRLLR